MSAFFRPVAVFCLGLLGAGTTLRGRPRGEGRKKIEPIQGDAVIDTLTETIR